jgi:hypothetical protein
VHKFFLSLTVLATLLFLAQWYCVVSVRKYVLERYAAISRRAAYLILGLLGLMNFLFVRLTFGGSIVGADSMGHKLASIVFFSYLGCVLVLTLFFWMLDAACALLNLKDWALRIIRGTSPLCVGAGHVSPSCHDRATPAAQEPPPLPSPANPGAAADLQSRTSRRAFLKWGAATGLTATGVLAGHGIAQGYSKPVVEEFDVDHPDLEGIDRPLSLIHVTDFHFGMFYGAPDLERLVDRLNSIEGDALFITGDVLHSPLSDSERAGAILSRLRPRRWGNIAVLGNHDIYAGMTRSVRSFKHAGLILLRDQWLTFREGAAVIHVGGIDDPMTNWLTGRIFPGFDSFMAKAPKGPGLRLLLSHRPAVLPLAAESGVDLVLAGHIHGGQVIAPLPGNEKGLSVAGLVSDYTTGWYKEGNCRLYVNRGVGLTFLPWRINCPAEIAVFRLTRPASALPGRHA